MDGDGYIRIVGRSKDVIIRGGENIPVAEVENLIYRHPHVAECAIVAMPDPRLGERACAFIVAKPTTQVTLADVRSSSRATVWPSSIGPNGSSSCRKCLAHPPANPEIQAARARRQSRSGPPRPCRLTSALAGSTGFTGRRRPFLCLR